ncbi:MAG: hypothetical protein WAM81_05045 [Acidimicrobiia bacterium]
MITQASKKMLYAAVGAPVVTARKIGERITDAGDKVGDLRDRVSEEFTRELNAWAQEGEKLILKIREREGVEEFVEDLTDRVDLDQIQEQVGKLREHLDEMLQSWRSSFKPATPEKIEVVDEPAAKAPAPRPVAAKKPAAKKPAATAKKPTASKPAAKKPAAKPTTSAA